MAITCSLRTVRSNGSDENYDRTQHQDFDTNEEDPYNFFERHEARQERNQRFYREMAYSGPEIPKLTPAERLELSRLPPFMYNPNAISLPPGMSTPLHELMCYAFPKMRRSHAIRSKNPNHPKMDMLLSEDWATIVDSPGELYKIADSAVKNRVCFKFGITHDPIYRWYDLKLNQSYNKMYVFITCDGNESSKLELSAVDQYRGRPGCDNVIRGGGSVSPSSPHHFYLSTRPASGVVRAPEKVPRYE